MSAANKCYESLETVLLEASKSFTPSVITYGFACQTQDRRESIGRFLDFASGIAGTNLLRLYSLRVLDIWKEVWSNVCGRRHSKGIAEGCGYAVDGSGDFSVGSGRAARFVVRGALASDKDGRRQSIKRALHRSKAGHDGLFCLLDNVESLAGTCS